MDQAIEVSAVGLFANGGQCCVASSRIFVQEGIYDEFVAKAAASASARKLGNPMAEDVDQGPQVDKIQFDKVRAHPRIPPPCARIPWKPLVTEVLICWGCNMTGHELHRHR